MKHEFFPVDQDLNIFRKQLFNPGNIHDTIAPMGTPCQVITVTTRVTQLGKSLDFSSKASYEHLPTL